MLKRTKRLPKVPKATCTTSAIPTGMVSPAVSTSPIFLANNYDDTNGRILLLEAKLDTLLERFATQPRANTTVTQANISGPSQMEIATAEGNPNELLRLLPLPLRQKILSLEYIEFDSLIPANVAGPTSETEICLSLNSAGVTSIKRPHQSRIVSIEDWLDAYSIFATVLVESFPSRSVELWHYQAHIRRLAREFVGLGWIRYDRLFRAKAASNRQISWMSPDPQLFIQVFTGMARSGCGYCSHPSHSTDQCQYRNVAVDSTSVAFAPEVRKASKGICYRYNSGEICSKQNCRFPHVCSSCGGNHPASDCHNNSAELDSVTPDKVEPKRQRDGFVIPNRKK